MNRYWLILSYISLNGISLIIITKPIANFLKFTNFAFKLGVSLPQLLFDTSLLSKFRLLDKKLMRFYFLDLLIDFLIFLVTFLNQLFHAIFHRVVQIEVFAWNENFMLVLVNCFGTKGRFITMFCGGSYIDS